MRSIRARRLRIVIAGLDPAIHATSPDELQYRVQLILDARVKPGHDEGESVRYAIVIEKAAGNYSAYVPDLPGCVATGDTVEIVEQEIRDAIRFHIDGLRDDGLPVPQPTAIANYVEA